MARGAYPWLKLGTSVAALVAVVWAIWYLNFQVQRLDGTAPAVTPHAASPSPESTAEPEPGAPRQDDPPSDETPTRPPIDFPEPQDATQKLFIDRLKNTVSFVYDGDSFMLADGTQVRLMAVDTPERDEPFHQEAREFARRALELKSVELRRCEKRPTDQHGRVLAHALVEGADIEEALLSFGWGEVFHDPACLPDCRPYWKLLLEAFRQKKGIFRDAVTEPTPAAVADRFVGKYALVVGVVNNVRESANALHLNFGSEWTTDFSVTVNKSDLEPFLRDKLQPHALVGMELTVFGKVVSSYGPRIFAVCPTQIVAVKAP
jgi:micrococcal nuclease